MVQNISNVHSYTRFLEERVQHLEDSVHQAEEALRKIKTASSIPVNNDIPNNATLLSPSSHASNTSIQSSQLDIISKEMGRMTITADGSREFLGTSSGVFFLVNALETHIATFPSARTMVTNLLPARLCSFWSQPSPGLASNFCSTVRVELPDLATAMELAEIFFAHARAPFPVVHEPSFMLLLRDTEHTNMHDRVLMYSVFALGARFKSDCAELGAAYAEEARHLRPHLNFKNCLFDLQVVLLYLTIELEW